MQTAQGSFKRCLPLFVLLATLGLTGCGGTDEAGEKKAKQDADTAQASETKKADPAEPVKKQMPKVKIQTSLGTIVVELNPEKAQFSVNNFLQYVNDGFYDETIFHEVDDGFAIIGGMYTQDLEEKPTRIPARNDARDGLKNVRGTISMTRDPGAIDGATSGFFINLADNTHLDHKNETPEGYGYSVFGHVVEGLEIADKIAKVKSADAETKDNKPLERVPTEPVVIRSIRVVR